MNRSKISNSSPATEDVSIEALLEVARKEAWRIRGTGKFDPAYAAMHDATADMIDHLAAALRAAHERARKAEAESMAWGALTAFARGTDEDVPPDDVRRLMETLLATANDTLAARAANRGVGA